MILIKSGKIEQALKSFSLAANIDQSNLRAKIYLQNCKILLDISNDVDDD